MNGIGGKRITAAHGHSQQQRLRKCIDSIWGMRKGVEVWASGIVTHLAKHSVKAVLHQSSVRPWYHP